MSGITFGLLIFGIDGIAHRHAPAIVILAELVLARSLMGVLVRPAPDAAGPSR